MSSNEPSHDLPLIDTRSRRRSPPRQLTWLGDIYADDVDAAQPLRFRLRELFVVITVSAVLLALFKSMGILGAALSFVVALAFTNQLYPSWREWREQEAMFDFVWGIVMPIVCLVFDPFVFKYDENLFDMAGGQWLAPSLTSAQFSAWSVPAYTFIVTQWICLGSLLVVGRPPSRFAAFLTGFLSTGFLFAGLIGVLIFLPSLLGVFAMGIGILGFTPLFTARAFYRRTRFTAVIASRAPHHEYLSVMGLGLALLLPLLAFLAGHFLGGAA